MMKVFGANISALVSDCLKGNLRGVSSFEMANQKIQQSFGIIGFFENNEECETLKEIVSNSQSIAEEPDRGEYGDFQTNRDLANKIVSHLAISKNSSPEIIIEPTCGKGNFIIASLQNFKGIKSIFGIEIYKLYVWETKFAIIDFFLQNPKRKKPEILISHCNVFDFDFSQITKRYPTKEFLIIGNPPWVTNSKLGTLNSSNLPKKSNFKKHSGLDAMTGKGNFDIAEYITMEMFRTFQKMKGNLALLVKNSVVKNIVFDQNKNKYSIASMEMQRIDSKTEYNVSVEASLFYCRLNSNPVFECEDFNFYDNKTANSRFGWSGEKFVSNISMYSHAKKIDGECPFIWRQGLKHDCSKIMELDKVNGHYVNGLNEEVDLEEDLVYSLLKSSDLKNTVIDKPRKRTIVTQRKVGQETKQIKTRFPKTYQYLSNHLSYFNARKSSIYKNKPLFSIFGIGEYSFKPYKVAISGLYKTFHFTLILPQIDKPVMLDDTCYLIGFDKLEFAVYTLILLNSDKSKQFLQAITFADAKRRFTKDILMRIDLLELAENFDLNNIQTELDLLNKKYNFNLTIDFWDDFILEMKPINDMQMKLFA